MRVHALFIPAFIFFVRPGKYRLTFFPSGSGIEDIHKIPFSGIFPSGIEDIHEISFSWCHSDKGTAWSATPLVPTNWRIAQKARWFINIQNTSLYERLYMISTSLIISTKKTGLPNKWSIWRGRSKVLLHSSIRHDPTCRLQGFIRI